MLCILWRRNEGEVIHGRRARFVRWRCLPGVPGGSGLQRGCMHRHDILLGGVHVRAVLRCAPIWPVRTNSRICVLPFSARTDMGKCCSDLWSAQRGHTGGGHRLRWQHAGRRQVHGQRQVLHGRAAGGHTGLQPGCGCGCICGCGPPSCVISTVIGRVCPRLAAISTVGKLYQ